MKTMKTRITSLVLALLMCFSAVQLCSAESYEYEEDESALLFAISGDGSEEKPFIIRDQEDLMLVSDFPDCHFVLANDLEVTGHWEPLCVLTDPFSGTFDGNGHTISGVSITGDYVYNGLFAQNSGTIRNVNLDISISRSGIPAQRYFGTIVGQNNAAGIIENCNVNYSVAVSYSNNVYSAVSSFVGGITGTNFGKVTHCRASGSVTPKGGQYHSGFYLFCVGGLTGGGNGGTFTECYVEITVPSSSYSHLRGFVGSSSSSEKCTFVRCAAFPTFTVGTNAEAYGVGQYGTFTDCYVNGTSTPSALYGFSNGGTTTNCYSVMSGVSNYGFNSNGTVTNCFYDKTVSGRTDTGHGEPKTTAAMKMKATYTKAGWDFENVWGIDPAINDGYPYLLWEYAEEEEPAEEPETYAVTYDANGGSGAPASQTKTEGEDLVLSQTEPTRDNYNFTHWLGSNGNIYAPGDTYSTDAALTLTAQWTEADDPGDYGGITGDGSEEDPFIIVTLEDLRLVSDFPDCCFVLANDLEVTGDWEPLCVLTDPFSGTFDGNGHTISGVSITGDYEYNGLFAQNSGTIRNIDLDISISRSDIFNSECFGTLAGQNNASGIIENCNVTYSVAVTYTAESSSQASWIGGITGVNDGTVVQCHASGDITSKGTSCNGYGRFIFVGGLAGRGNGGTFTECYAEIDVLSSEYSRLGGFFGSYSSTQKCTFERCAVFPTFAVGNCTDACSTGYIGTFTDCYVIGSANPSVTYGFSEGGTTTNCYSVMSGVSNYGFNCEGVVTSCFYDETISNRSDTGYGTPLSTAAMKMKATYTNAGWDFENVWGIDENINDGYPYLLWEYAEEEEPAKEPETYVVTYDANGGSGAPASQVKTEGTALVLSMTEPTRDNYSFTHWLGSDGNTYAPGASYTTDAALTLTAQWEYVPATYAVTYDANGGSGAPASQVKTEGEDLVLSMTEPTREHYSFTHWLGSDGNTYVPGASYTTDAALTLTAQWEESDILASGICGDNLTWTLSNDYVLTISGTGGMYDFEYMEDEEPYDIIDYPWLDYRDEITAVVIEDGVESIGNSAFREMASLESVIIPDTVTKIGYGAFWDCSLTELTIPASVTDYTLFGAGSLERIIISEGVTSIPDGAFAECDSLVSIEIPGTVESIGDYAFFHCDVLQSVIFNEGVETIGDSVFDCCPAITSIAIPASVTEIGSTAFGGCYGITEFTVDEDNAFYCADEYGVLYNKDKTELVCFPASQEEFTEYVVPESVTVIGDYAVCCPYLTRLTVYPGVTEIGECGIGGDDLTVCGKTGSYIHTYALEHNINFEALPDEEYAVTYDANGGIGAPASQTKTEGEDLVLSMTEPTREHYNFTHWLGSDGNTYAPGASYTTDAALTLTAQWEESDILASGICGDNLTWTLSNEYVLTISGTGDMYDFEVIASDEGPWDIVDYPWFDYHNEIKAVAIEDGAESIGNWAFAFMSALESVIISGTVKSIGGSAFSYCNVLQNVYFSEGIETIGFGVFDCCSAITSITIPASVSKVEAEAFRECVGITEFTVAEGNAFYCVDEYGVLYSKDKTELVCYPAGQKRISEYVVPESVTVICNCAVWFPGYLTKLTVYPGVTKIGGCGICGEENFTLCGKNGSYVHTYALEHDINFEALPDEEYAVTYDANGGSCAPASQTKTEGEDLVLSMAEPIRIHYYFTGWLGSDGNTYQPGASYTTNAALTLTAQWTPINVTSVSISKTERTLKVGDCFTLTATVEPAGAAYKTVIWSSTDPLVASVDGNGNVTAVGAGFAEIVATTTDGGHTARCSVAVIEPTAYNAEYDFFGRFDAENEKYTLDIIFDGPTFNMTALGFELTVDGAGDSKCFDIALEDGLAFSGIDSFEEYSSANEFFEVIYAVNGAFEGANKIATVILGMTANQYREFDFASDFTLLELPTSIHGAYENGAYRYCKAGGDILNIDVNCFDIVFGDFEEDRSVDVTFTGIDDAVTTVTSMTEEPEMLADYVFTAVTTGAQPVVSYSIAGGDAKTITPEGNTYTVPGLDIVGNVTIDFRYDVPIEEDENAVFTFGSVSGVAGDTVDVSLSLTSTETINSIAVYEITYDETKLEFVGFDNYEEIEDLSILPPTFDSDSMAIILALSGHNTFDGDLCTLTFRIKDDAAVGDAVISALSLVKDGSKLVPSSVTDGKVTVFDQLLGDIDCDGDVDVDDAVLLFRHSMLPDIYTIPYRRNIDFTKDGNVDVNDAVLLFRYSMLPDIYPISD